MVRERFTSRVALNRANRTVNVSYADGPFKHMANHWRFEPAAGGGCLIDFHVDFEFRSALLQKLIACSSTRRSSDGRSLRGESATALWREAAAGLA